jgi:tRNA/tmRNA/rRNA uracil-C5-methylase (TrmA/RlmC/RlmD family)
LNVGDRITLEIEGVAFGGNGIARVDGMVVFVPFTVDGDVVEAEVVRVKRSYCAAELRKILVPSSFRIDPSCEWYSVCGGCRYQHVTGDHELALKERQVQDAFERIGKFPQPPIKPIIPSPALYGYRQKAEFHRARDASGVRTAGFMGVDGRTLVAVDRCAILDDSINEEYRRVRQNRTLMQQAPARMVFWSNRSWEAEGDVTRRVGHREMIVPFRGFFQANALLVERLATLVGEACRESREETILDCCCGSGLFALFAARRDQAVIGIDVDGESLRCAERNMEFHGFSRTRFFRSPLEKVLKKLPPVGTVILDPPRTGATPRSIDGIAALGPSRVVYVSCDPATQARDARRFADHGFVLKDLQPLDMFPRTMHVETVAVLERPS